MASRRRWARWVGLHCVDCRGGDRAEEIQIWTDVDGMLTADPTILAGGYRVETCSFAERRSWRISARRCCIRLRCCRRLKKYSGADFDSRRPEWREPSLWRRRRRVRLRFDRCLQEEHYAGEYCFHADADGAWFPAAHFRDFRSLRTRWTCWRRPRVSVSLTVDNTRALEAIREEIQEFRGEIEDHHAIVCPGGRKYPQNPGTVARVFRH